MSDLVKRLRIKAGMIEMGDMIAWGSDSALMREAADALEVAAPDVQGEPVGWQPIETAPHGEEVLLGWLEWDGAWKIEVSQASWGWSTKTASNISRHGQATHWMPLPYAPQSSELLSSNPRPLSSKSSEPVGEVRFKLGAPYVVYAELYGENLPSLAPGTKLYAAPQPATDVSDLLESVWMYKGNDGEWKPFMNEQHRLNTLADGGWDVREFFTTSCQENLQPAEQQPAPDVEGLVEALETLLEVRVVEADASYGLACAKAEHALAPYRKEGDV